jgi:hypothetical protein
MSIAGALAEPVGFLVIHEDRQIVKKRLEIDKIVEHRRVQTVSV